ncbi:helix-turn-helix domain-containing protein [Leuconostoc lactis]
MNTFDRVRDLANERNISIAEVERRAGLTKQTISNWRRSNPSGESLDKVATVFNVSVDYLLGRTDNRKTSIDIADNSLKLSYNGHELTERQRSDLSVYIQTMIKTKYW